MPGPIPKRSDETRRRNKPEIPMDSPSTSHTPLVTWPEPSESWHPDARDWYLSLPLSPQSQYMTHSDVQEARYIAHMMTITLTGYKPNSMLVGLVLQGMTDMMTSEASRRRLRIEIAKQEHDTGPTAGQSAVTDIRSRMRKTP